MELIVLDIAVVEDKDEPTEDAEVEPTEEESSLAE
jgi:hypothetical protein